MRSNATNFLIFICNFIFFQSCVFDSYQHEMIDLSLQNLHTCDIDTFNERNIVTVECIEAIVKNNFNDTVWIYKEKNNNLLVCDLYFYYLDQIGKRIIINNYSPDLVSTEFAPIPPNKNINLVIEYISYRNSYIKNWYASVYINLIKNYPFENINKNEKTIKDTMQINTFYKLHYLFYIENNKKITKSYINIDSLCNKQLH